MTEFRRVLRPGGQLRFYEHVRSRDAIFARYQRAADLIWPRLMGGCHAERRTQVAIGRVFHPRAVPRFPFPAVRGLLTGRPTDHRRGSQGGDSQS